MSGFYEVTTAPRDGGGGRQIRKKARLGQLNHESSRRQPHPLQQAGQHRPTGHATQLNQAEKWKPSNGLEPLSTDTGLTGTAT